MARDVLTERRVAQAEPLQVRSTAVDKEASNARPTQRHRALDSSNRQIVSLMILMGSAVDQRPSQITTRLIVFSWERSD